MLTSDSEVGPDGGTTIAVGDAPAGPDTAPGSDDAPVRRRPVARVLHAVGRLMMTSGVVILLLVAYLLWGTNLETARAQDDLADEFDQLVDDEAADTPAQPDDPPSATTPASPAATTGPPAAGEVVGSFTIPAIGRSTPYYVVEGTGTDQLKRGAAHYPGTPLPGQAGNASVAGHRTTYGAPLHDVEDLVEGDEIHFTTVQGEFTYAVRDVFIVKPWDTWVIDPQDPTPEKPEGDDLLTLTACHPKFSAAERIIVVAELVGNPVEKLDGQDEAAQRTLDDLGVDPTTDGAIDAFATEPALTFPGAWWGVVCMVLWGLTRLGAVLLRRTRVPWIVAYVVGTPLALLALHQFFGSFSYEGFARGVGLGV